MENIKLQQAAKAYQEKEYNIWTGKGMASDLQTVFIAGAEWQLQQLVHPYPPGEQGADGATTIKEVMKEKAIEAFNEAMIYFESPDCPTAKEALKHFIACLDQEPDSSCSEKPNNWK